VHEAFPLWKGKQTLNGSCGWIISPSSKSWGLSQLAALAVYLPYYSLPSPSPYLFLFFFSSRNRTSTFSIFPLRTIFLWRKCWSSSSSKAWSAAHQYSYLPYDLNLAFKEWGMYLMVTRRLYRCLKILFCLGIWQYPWLLWMLRSSSSSNGDTCSLLCSPQL